MQSYSNCAYMHTYCNIFVNMHNFTSDIHTDISVFYFVKMHKIHIFAFCKHWYGCSYILVFNDLFW